MIAFITVHDHPFPIIIIIIGIRLYYWKGRSRKEGHQSPGENSFVDPVQGEIYLERKSSQSISIYLFYY